MGTKKFFKKVGRGVQASIGEASKSFGKGVGGVFGTAAGTYALEAAPALLAFKTGGKIPGPRNRAIQVLAHGQEHILPAGVKLTQGQRNAIAKNKQLQKVGKFY